MSNVTACEHIMREEMVAAGGMQLAVVILNWNAADDTAACLRSVRAWEATALVSRPVIWVVDNGSRPPGIDPIR